jgi:thiol-disulfide isomerase/thioredoxin
MATLARRLLLALALLAAAAAGVSAARSSTGADAPLPVEPLHPSLAGATGWLNSGPLALESLRGKVVLIDFWTYSCINCLRTLPYVRAWSRAYAAQGLVVVGVHAPEFGFEHDPQRVRRALQDLHADWPVAIDDDFAIWRSFRNQAWPALYFIDAQGRVRHHQLGEGGYDESERVIRRLLQEARAGAAPLPAPAAVDARGIGQAPDLAHLRSPETYLGYAHADEAAPPDLVADRVQRHAARAPRLNAWTLGGDWVQRPEFVEAAGPDGTIAMRFHARDLHLVLGPADDGRPVGFRVTIDGRAPGADHGVDVDGQGRGEVAGERLYQLVRLHDAVADHTFEIRFDRAGARAWAFTFG